MNVWFSKPYHYWYKRLIRRDGTLQADRAIYTCLHLPLKINLKWCAEIWKQIFLHVYFICCICCRLFKWPLLWDKAYLLNCLQSVLNWSAHSILKIVSYLKCNQKKVYSFIKSQMTYRTCLQSKYRLYKIVTDEIFIIIIIITIFLTFIFFKD